MRVFNFKKNSNMATIIIQQVDSINFLYNGDIKSRSFRAFVVEDYISLVGDGADTYNLANGVYYNNFIIKDLNGVILVDGTSGGAANEIVRAINEIVNFKQGSVSVIPDNLIFADTTARDLYFNPLNLDSLSVGLEISINDDGSGNRTIQKWIGPAKPSSYVAAFWHQAFNGKAFSHTYIAEGDEVASSLLVINTPTKYQLPVTIRKVVDFSITDIGAGVLALTYSGERNVTLVLHASTSMISSANNAVIKLKMYKNGAYSPGSVITRKIGTGSDIGAVALSTSFEASKGDYFEVFIESNVATTVTFINASMVLSEE